MRCIMLNVVKSRSTKAVYLRGEQLARSSV